MLLKPVNCFVASTEEDHLTRSSFLYLSTYRGNFLVKLPAGINGMICKLCAIGIKWFFQTKVWAIHSSRLYIHPQQRYICLNIL